MDLAEKLFAIEEIKQLKARYFRAVDTKDWVDLAEVFCEDAVFDMGGGTKVNPAPGETRVVTGGAAIVDVLRTSLDKKMVSVHQGHCHEVEILSATEARGVISMEDLVALTEDGKIVSGLNGWGHYHESYRKVGGKWRIYRSKVTRLRIDGFGPWFEGLRKRQLSAGT